MMNREEFNALISALKKAGEERIILAAYNRGRDETARRCAEIVDDCIGTQAPQVVEAINSEYPEAFK